jgi:aspartyl-tRNA(Asn)/glutamyl-tRNA(Gln) amidotransferase subunit A
MGSSTESSAFFTTRNPWDLGRVPGGSSGGSAAAVSAGLASFALGTDTGGSIRQPAALCGVVGLKPTYGRVSRRGIVDFASSLDQAGTLTRTAADASLVLETIAGVDPADPTTSDRPVDDSSSALRSVVPRHADARPLTGLTIGVPGEYFDAGLDPAVNDRVQEAIDLLRSLGAAAAEVSLPHTAYAVATYYLIAPAEASANLARYDGLRYGPSSSAQELWARIAETRGTGFGREVKRRIMLGTFALSSGYQDQYYGQACRVRELIRRDFEQAFRLCDVIVGPTAPEVAFPLGSRVEDPLAMYLSDTYTIGPSLAGCPALSVPCGLARGLPVGLQLVGPRFGEGRLLALAHEFEYAGGFSEMRPPLAVQLQ